MEVTAKKFTAWCGVVIAALTAGGMMIAGWNKAPVPESVEAFHNESLNETLVVIKQMMEEQQEQLDNTETNAVVDRISRIADTRCDSAYQAGIVNQQMLRYQELTGATFRLPECDDD